MRGARILGRILWVVAALMAVATAAELLLQARTRRIEGARPRSAAAHLELAYDPFIVQHLHLQYFFFFPLDPAERRAINAIVVQF